MREKSNANGPEPLDKARVNLRTFGHFGFLKEFLSFAAAIQ